MTGNEIHPYHEILYCMDGDVTFLSEKFQEVLTGPTLLIIPKACYHQFCIKNQNAYTRLVLNFPDIAATEELLSALTEVKIVKHLSSPLAALLQRICQVLCSEQPLVEHHIYLYGAFLMLLAELKLEDIEMSSPRLREDDHLISRCVQYIDTHFTSDISAEMLAREMNVSESTLFHCFKKELGISMYKYITEKRLIHAHKLIAESGNRPKFIWNAGIMITLRFTKLIERCSGRRPLSAGAPHD